MYKQKDDDDDTPNAEKNYKSVIYSMEIEKINYILKHYLRIRLEKVYCLFIMQIVDPKMFLLLFQEHDPG